MFLVSPTSGRTTRKRCDSGRVVAANRHIKVVRQGPANTVTALYACHRRGRRTLKMGEIYSSGLSDAYTAHIRLNGRYLAYGYAESDHYGRAVFDVYVWNSESGKLRWYQTGLIPPARHDSGSEGVGPVTDIVLSRTGHVAWIVRNDYTPYYERHYEVWAQRGRLPDLLDSDPHVVPDSLKLVGRRIQWRHGETLRADKLADAHSVP